MIIHKDIEISKIMLPNAKIKLVNPFSNLLIQVLKLIELHKTINRDQLHQILGFSNILIDQIINKLEDRIKEKNGEYYVTKEGELTLKEKQIVEISEIQLRLVISENPFLVLNHYFPIYFEDEVIERNELLVTLFQRKKVIGLDESVITVGDKLYEKSRNQGIITYGGSKKQIKVIEKSNQTGFEKKYSISTSKEDNYIVHLNGIFKKANQNKWALIEQQLNYEVSNLKRININIDGEVVIFSGDIDETDYENVHKLLNQINYKPNQTIKMKIKIEEDWYFEFFGNVDSNIENLVYIFFSKYIQQPRTVHMLLDSISYKEEMNSIWLDFLQTKKSNFTDLNFNLFFNILWSENSPISKLLAARILESDIIG